MTTQLKLLDRNCLVCETFPVIPERLHSNDVLQKVRSKYQFLIFNVNKAEFQQISFFFIFQNTEAFCYSFYNKIICPKKHF